MTASARNPSYFNSKIQSGLSNGAGRFRSGIGWNGRDIRKRIRIAKPPRSNHRERGVPLRVEAEPVLRRGLGDEIDRREILGDHELVR